MNDSRGLRHTLGIGLGLGLITLALYWPCTRHGFLDFDDQQYVTENYHVRAGLTTAGLVWAFGAHASNWHPLTWLSHMLDCQLFALHPAGHHLVNVLLHTANTLLLFLFLKRMTCAAWRSAALAALFAWHPMHVESVAWVAERKDVLCAFFFLLAGWAYTEFVRRRKNLAEAGPRAPTSGSLSDTLSDTLSPTLSNPIRAQLDKVSDKVSDKVPDEVGDKVDGRATRGGGTRRYGWYLLALLFFALAQMAKPMAVTLPFVLLLLDVWPLRRTSSPIRLCAEKIPFFLLSAAACFLTVWAQEPALVSTGGLPVPERIGHALLAYCHYVGALFVPRHLAIYYPYERVLRSSEVLVSAVLLLAFSAFAVSLAKRRPYLLVGWLWFVGILVPVIGLVQVGDQAWADRYTYLPSIGFFLALVWGVADLGEGFCKPGSASTAEFLEEVPEGSFHRKLCRKLCRKLLSTIARIRQSFRQGFRQRNEHAVIKPDFKPLPAKPRRLCSIMWITGAAAVGLPLLALSSRQISFWKDSKSVFEHAAQVTPRNHLAIALLGSLLAKQDRWDEAIADYRLALSYSPRYAEAHFLLGNALDRQGKLDQAILEYRQALSFKPAQEQTHIFLGIALAKEGKYEEALTQYAAALKLNPESASAHNNMARVLHTMGRLDQATEHYSAALKIDPALAEAHNNLGILELQNGRVKEGIAELREALRLKPGDRGTEFNLALGLNQEQQWGEAARLFAQTVSSSTRDPNAHYQFATALAHQNKPREAARQYAAALLLQPDFIDALDGLAWLLATCPSPEIRNGNQALPMAERVCALTNGTDPEKLKTLAAVYAENGRFEDALRTAEKARALARTAGRQELLRQCERMLGNFNSHKPWRENGDAN